MSRPRGIVVVDGTTFPIIDIRLRDGRIYLIARAEGPLDAGHADTWTAFGEDGQGMGQAVGIGGLAWPSVPAGNTVTLFVPIAFDTLEARKGR